VNPYLILMSCLAQVAILVWQSAWMAGMVWGFAVCSLIAAFAFTRMRWGAHLDMYLAMAAWGGLGMLLPGLATGVTCHHAFNWSHYGLMSLGMWVFSLVPIWREARCVAIARQEGRAWSLLLLDGLGMQLGMGLAHLPLLWLPMGDIRVAWFSQASMLLGMGLGMMAAQRLSGEWERQDVAAMG
jgi:hypothetical protein